MSNNKTPQPGFYWFKYDREAVEMGLKVRGINPNDPSIKDELADEFAWQVVKIDRNGLLWCFGVGAQDMVAQMQTAFAISGHAGGDAIKHHPSHWKKARGTFGPKIDRKAMPGES